MLEFRTDNHVDGPVLFQLTEKELMDIIELIEIVKSMSLKIRYLYSINSVIIIMDTDLIMVYRQQAESSPPGTTLFSLAKLPPTQRPSHPSSV